MKFETRPLLLPTDADYESLSEIPPAVLQPLTIYNAINEHDRGIESVDEVHDLLDDFAGQQAYGVYELEEGRLLAVSNYRPMPKRGLAWIEGIAVRPSARKLRVGSFALKHLIDLAEQSSEIKTVGLQSVKPAIPFYERHGFEIDEGHENKARPTMRRTVS